MLRIDGVRFASVVLAVAMALFTFDVMPHTLHDEAPEESPLDRYVAKLESARLSRINNYETEIKSTAQYLRREYGRIPKLGDYEGIHRANIFLVEWYHRMRVELPKLRRGDTSSLTVSLAIVQPKLFDVGKLKREYSQFESYSFIVEEVLSGGECRVSCTRVRRSGSQGKPLVEGAPEHIRDLIIIGRSTENLIVGERLPRRLVDHVYHVHGVRDNKYYEIHPIEVE